MDSLAVEHAVDSLNTISRKCIQTQEFDKGMESNNRAMSIALKNRGRLSSSYASCCFFKAKLFLYQGMYDDAEHWQLEYNSILASLQGEENENYAWGLDDLGQLYEAMGKFDKSEKLHLKAIDIFKKIKGVRHPDYAWTLNDLGKLYRTMGAYEKAEPLYIEAKNIWENALGKEHPDYAWSLNNLANLYNFMGSYEKAEPLLENAVSIWLKIYGEENAAYASGLNNLAALYYNMGLYIRAEPLFKKSCELREKLLGKNNPDYAGSLNNLAGVYMKMDSFESAEKLYKESLVIRDKIYGREHAEYANGIGNLGILYNLMGRKEKAESCFLEAISIWEKTKELEHPEYAVSLNHLANLYADTGFTETAEVYYLKAYRILVKVLGTSHPDFVQIQTQLAKLYVREARIQEAMPLLKSVAENRKVQLIKAVQFLSEYELSQYIHDFQNQEDELGTCYFLCSADENNSERGTLLSLAYDHALFYKGFLSTAATRLKFLSSSTAESRAIYLQLKSYRRRLAMEYALPISERTSVPELEAKANSAEKLLAKTVSGYAEAVRQVQWKDVQKSLGQNDAAIEFVHFNFNFPNATDRILYAALLVKKNVEHPILVPLFEEKSLDSLLHSFSERKADYVNRLYSLADRGAYAEKRAEKSLYEMIWKPLEKVLSGIQTIYYSPSGLLHRINLDAIPLSETETLADRYHFYRLNSTRQLVIPDDVKIVNNDAVLYGGIQFDQDTIPSENGSYLASRSEVKSSAQTLDSTSRGGSWNFLSGTEREVNSIEEIMKSTGFQAILKKAKAATEESFKNIGAHNFPSPRILHLATHGYFFPDPHQANSAKRGMTQDSASGERTATAALSKPKFQSETKETIFQLSDHPMLRSGLIFAGGNAAWQGKQTLEGREDGVLTAYEISQLDLSNTELVVLSACETGLGDIEGNEGVYGLQRAFKIAGVKYIIMSLWQVPDKQTSLLMTTFYKKFLEAEGPDKGGNKMSIPNAFHAAQKELRDIGLDPYQWAGFVLIE